MKPLRLRIRAASVQKGIPQQVIEKDYVLSYILAGITSHPVLHDVLVFKGGTALKKLFFGDYRFSEDLDFSGPDSPKEEKLEGSLREALEETHRLLSLHGPFAIQLERYLERDPHPNKQEAFIVRVQFPWQREPLCRVKLEITRDEPVLLEPEKRRLIHGFEEDMSCNVRCYCLEEIVAEKLRTLLQTHQKLVLRGWNRPRARDYYDLWRILDAFSAQLNPEEIGPLLERKNSHRGVTYHSLDDFFTNELVTEAHRHWETNLKPFMTNVPECGKVLEQLRAHIRKLFPRTE